MHLLERSLADYGLYCAMPYMDEEIRACWEHTANKNWVQAHVFLTSQDSCSPPLFPGQGLCFNYLRIYLSGSSIMFRKCLWNWTPLDDCVTQNLECDVCWGKLAGIWYSAVHSVPCSFLASLSGTWESHEIPKERVSGPLKEEMKKTVCFAHIRPLKMIHHCIPQFVQLMSIWVVFSLKPLWIKLP